MKWGDFKQEEAEKILSEVLRQNAEEREYQPKSLPNANVPILSKYFYVHGTGRHQSKTVDNKDEWTNTSDSQDVVMQSLADVASSSQEKIVKAENPMLALFKEKLSMLQGSATSLQKCEQQGVVLLSRFQVAGRTDGHLKTKHEHLEKMMTTLKDFAAAVLLKIADMEAVNEDDPAMGHHHTDMEALFDTASHHIGGYREMYKRHNAMLT